MSLIKKIKHQLAEFKKKNKQSTFIEILIKLINSSWRLISAKWYLRKCNEVGALVTTNGKPKIVNNGYIKIADGARIWSSINLTKIFVEKGGRLLIGKNSRINGAHISVSSEVNIGDNVRIAPYVLIMDDDYHDVEDIFGKQGKKAPIIIENNVWVATHAKILKGVTLGQGSVVATGAVVTKNVPPFTVVAGVPAKVIKILNK